MWKVQFVLFYVAACLLEIGQALPTILNAHSTSTGKEWVNLAWTVSGTSNEDYRNEIVYLVYDATQNPNIRSTHTVHTAKDVTTATIRGLRSGTTYEAQIHTKTAVKDGKWSTKILFTTSGVRPPRTVNIRAITDTTATVDWTPPIGVTPEFYKISLQQTNDPDGEVPDYPPVAHPATELTLWNLKPQTPYILFIQTRIGKDLSTKMKDGFATNTATVLDASNDQPEETSVIIRWKTLHARYHIARYDVELTDFDNPNPKTRKQLLKTHGNQEVRHLLVEDLKPARTYSYRVRSIYRINGGRGQWSEVKFFITKLPPPPSMPTEGKVVDHAKTSALFRWTAPQYVLDILSYDIQYGKQNERPEPIVNTDSSETSYVLSDLQSGTFYTVKTRAIAQQNLIGNWSTYATFTTKGPKPISSITITEITDIGAKIGWALFTGETAEKIKFVVTEVHTKQIRKTEFLNGNETQFYVTSLKPATGYLVEVLVIKGEEESSVTSYGFATNTNLDVLSLQPKHPKVVPRTNNQPLSELHYEFDKIPNVVVKFYTVSIQGFDVPHIPFHHTKTFPPSIGGSRQSVKLDNIQSGYKYKLRSRGVFNDNSTGKWSTIIGTFVPGPRPVRGISMRDISHKDVTVAWQSGYDNADVDYGKQEYIITLYQFGIEERSKELQEIDRMKASAYENQVVFKDKLQATRRYEIKIVIRISSFADGEHQSTPKRLAFRADSQKLPAPILNDIHIEKDSATFYWNRIPNRNDIKYYEVDFKTVHSDDFKRYTTQNGLTDSYKFTNLDTQTLYTVRIRAVDLSGKTGSWLEESFNLNNGLREKVEQMKLIKKTSSTATLTWKAPKSSHLKMYEIELWSPARNIKEFVLTKVLTTEFTLEDLHPGTSYSYRMRTVAINENIKGPWSQIRSFTTEVSLEDSSTNTGIIVAVAIAILILIIVIIVTIILCKKRGKRNNQNRFNVRFSKNDDGIKEIA